MVLREIVNRIKDFYGVRYNKEVSKILGIQPRTLANYLSDNRIPWKQLAECSERDNISFDWLVFGRGSPEGPTFGVSEDRSIYEIQTNQDEVYRLAALLYEVLGTAQDAIDPDQFQQMLKWMHRNALKGHSYEKEDIAELVAMQGTAAN